jgi:hypothetical protein
VACSDIILMLIKQNDLAKHFIFVPEIWPGTPAILTNILHSFPQFLQVNIRIVPKSSGIVRDKNMVVDSAGQFRRLYSNQFLCSQAHILVGWHLGT